MPACRRCSCSAICSRERLRRRAPPCYDTCAIYDRLLGDDTVLITPTANAESWAPEGPLPTTVAGVTDPGICVNTTEFNTTGHPVVSVPIGRDSAGVPFGLQIVAPRWRDGMCLALAEVIEQAAPWLRSRRATSRS